MFQILGFAHHWANRLPLTYIMRELDISSNTAVDWASFCREVLLNAYLSTPQKLGGDGRTVEIDESKFGKRKYHRGHKVDGAWVFGGVERESGRVFMEVVEKRDSATLLPLIRKWILPGTRIISDCWKAYKDLEEYQHLTVNHSINFVDAESGEHTNTIESTWRHAKESMGSHNRKKAHIPGNLARYMFLKAVRAKKGDYAEEFYRLAGKVYKPGNIDVEMEEEGEMDDEDIDLFD